MLSTMFKDMVQVDVDFESVMDAVNDLLDMIEEVGNPNWKDGPFDQTVESLYEIVDEGVINNAFINISDDGTVMVPAVAVPGFYAFLKNARNWNLYEDTMSFIYCLMYDQAWDIDPESDLTLWYYRPYWLRSLSEESASYCQVAA